MMQRLPLVSDQLNATLTAHAQRLRATDLRVLLDTPSGRADRLLVEGAGLVLDATRQRLDVAALDTLLAAARESGLPRAIEAMFAGEAVNATEGRAALHTALRSRSTQPLTVGTLDVRAAVAAERARCRQFAASLSSGGRKGATGQRITDVVNIGIGGSDLGPVMVLEALHGFANPRLRVHFVSNVDGTQFVDTVSQLEPASTLFIVCSKTFTTQETQANARLARRWISDKLGAAAVPRHFAAVSVNQAAMDEFGIGADARFTMWDWVGGRYSVWSAIGLAVEIGIGSGHFEEFLAGAEAVDEHFRDAPLEQNLPVLHGLVAAWNRSLLGLESLVVLPYDQRLHRFPAYLQQLLMESNGKHVRRDGSAVTCATGPVVWGEPGSNGQHSFFQLLHQGTAGVAIDFLLGARSSVGLPPSHDLATANCLAQAEAFARGLTVAEAAAELAARGLSAERAAALAPHKVHPGNRPGSVIAFARLDPATLGRLVALYEHSVYVASVLWDINPFDQWGVELGKRLATDVLPAVTGDAPPAPGLAPLLGRLRSWRDAV